ncbi:hypothetical protein ACFRIB_46680 [Streptomyces mirabilis]|uniref:hypothetical protein n=1 Tax=Streptomyces mirabilis TaxID=68239 RepID=UPI003694F63B
MTARRPCPPAPGPLEEYAARFDDLFFSLAQRRGFREYLTGLLAPRERNKTITCLAGAEPVAGAGMPGVQRLQFFLSESPWEAELVNDRRLELLREESATALSRCWVCDCLMVRRGVVGPRSGLVFRPWWASRQRR